MGRLTTVLVTCVLLISAVISPNQAYFGLSSRLPISSSSLFAYRSFNQSMTLASSSRELCELFSLPDRLRRTCRQEKGIAPTLMEAFKLSLYECQRQFERDRWNCAVTDSVSRINLLKNAFKETAFLFAISSSSLVHSLSRACSSGQLAQCTCDESLDDVENRRTWLWAGCGDNVRFGQKFAWKFMQQKKQNSKDLRARVDRHNAEVGIKVVKDFVQKRCKCHGVSGTCTMKTCWKQTAHFNEIGRTLKSKYDRAVPSYASNEARITPSSSRPKRAGLHHHPRSKYPNRTIKLLNMLQSNYSRTTFKTRKDITAARRIKVSKTKHRSGGSTTTAVGALALGAKPKELVYLDKSPDFCHKSRYSAGTSGRVCVRGSGCQVLCCGRGHNIQVKTVTSSCHCRVIWCCNVECQVCQHQKEIYTCK